MTITSSRYFCLVGIVYDRKNSVNNTKLENRKYTTKYEKLTMLIAYSLENKLEKEKQLTTKLDVNSRHIRK